MKKLNKNNGLTLLELLISLSIILILVLGLFKLINSTMRISTKNDRDIKALNILQSEIENLRSQMKSSKDDDGKRLLTIIDDSITLDSKVRELSFNENVVLVEYRKIDKTTNSEYNIRLVINRELIMANKNGEGDSITSSFNDYEYTIDISSELNDQYFSKKKTEIKDVKILAGNLDLSEGEGEGEGEGEIIIQPNRTISHGHHQVILVSNGQFRDLLKDKSNKGRFIEYKDTHLDEHSNQIIPPPENIWDVNGCSINRDMTGDSVFENQDVVMTLEYKKIIDNKNYIVMKLSIDDMNGGITESFSGNQYYGYSHKSFNKIGIEVENAGVVLKNLYIDGKYIGDVRNNTVYEFKNTMDDVTLRFDGFDLGEYPNQHADNSKVYIEFAD